MALRLFLRGKRADIWRISPCRRALRRDWTIQGENWSHFWLKVAALAALDPW